MTPAQLRHELLLACVLAAALLLLLNACAAMPDDWQGYPDYKPLPAVVMRVSAQEVRDHCQRNNVMGCAIRDYQTGVCTAYVDTVPLPETIPH